MTDHDNHNWTIGIRDAWGTSVTLRADSDDELRSRLSAYEEEFKDRLDELGSLIRAQAVAAGGLGAVPQGSQVPQPSQGPTGSQIPADAYNFSWDTPDGSPDSLNLAGRVFAAGDKKNGKGRWAHFKSQSNGDDVIWAKYEKKKG